MECSICFGPIVDKVSMTCSSQHSFCFKCLLRAIEVTSELNSCPNCRGGDKYIMITNGTGPTGSGFYSLEYFKKSLPFLQKILGDSVIANTCLISEIILICYIKNQKQLNLAHKLLSNGIDDPISIDDIVPFIKWDEKRNLEDLGEVIGGLAELFGMSHVHAPNSGPGSIPRPSRPPPEQRERRTNERPIREQRERGPRIILGSGPSPFGPSFLPFLFGPGNSE